MLMRNPKKTINRPGTNNRRETEKAKLKVKNVN